MSNDKLDDLLLIGCAFDWITPLWAILQDFANGSAVHFGIMADGCFTRGDIRQILSKQGVSSWGYLYNLAGDLIMLSVPQAQASKAQYVLTRAGVPVLYSPNVVNKPVAELGSVVKLGKMKIVKNVRAKKA